MIRIGSSFAHLQWLTQLACLLWRTTALMLACILPVLNVGCLGSRVGLLANQRLLASYSSLAIGDCNLVLVPAVLNKRRFSVELLLMGWHEILLQLIWIQGVWCWFFLVCLTLRYACLVAPVGHSHLTVLISHISLIGVLFPSISCLNSFLTALPVRLIVRNISIWLGISVGSFSLSAIYPYIFLLWRAAIRLLRLACLLAGTIELNLFSSQWIDLLGLNPLWDTLTCLDRRWTNIFDRVALICCWTFIVTTANDSVHIGWLSRFKFSTLNFSLLVAGCWDIVNPMLDCCLGLRWLSSTIIVLKICIEVVFLVSWILWISVRFLSPSCLFPFICSLLLFLQLSLFFLLLYDEEALTNFDGKIHIKLVLERGL